MSEYFFLLFSHLFLPSFLSCPSPLPNSRPLYKPSSNISLGRFALCPLNFKLNLISYRSIRFDIIWPDHRTVSRTASWPSSKMKRTETSTWSRMRCIWSFWTVWKVRLPGCRLLILFLGSFDAMFSTLHAGSSYDSDFNSLGDMWIDWWFYTLILVISILWIFINFVYHVALFAAGCLLFLDEASISSSAATSIFITWRLLG